MKTSHRIGYGLLLVIVIFLLANLAGVSSKLTSGFFTNSSITHGVMLLLALVAIFIFRGKVDFNIAMPEISKIFKPILFGILTAFIVNFSVNLITRLSGVEVQQHQVTASMSPLQVFVFIFLLASVAEELLFRGFLQNILHPLKEKKITFAGVNLSFPVIISAVTFGLIHLILISTGANFMFLFRIILFTTTLGIVAGYYQEKYDNHVYAIVVHMSGNLPALLGAIIT